MVRLRINICLLALFSSAGPIFAESQCLLTVSLLEMGRDMQAESVSLAATRESRVLSSGVQGRFKLGFETDTAWLRGAVDCANAPSDLVLEIGSPVLDYVDVFVRENESAPWFQRFSTGDRRVFQSRPLQTRSFAFPGLLADKSSFLVRVRRAGSLQVNFRFLSERDLAADENLNGVLMGIYSGIGLAMIIYNLFLWFSVRDASYVYYVILMGSIVLGNLSYRGLTFQYIWPAQSWWGDRSPTFFLALSLFAGLMFTRKFLDVARLSRIIDNLLLLILAVSMMGVAAALFAPPRFAVIGLTGLVIPVGVSCLLVACFALWRGNVQARFFLVAVGITAAASILTAISTLSQPFFHSSGEVASDVPLFVASAMDTMLFSLGLANKINVLRAEKDASVRQQTVMEEEILTLNFHSLQERMKPHFLFNALNSLRFLILRDSGRAAEAVIQLADLYRFLTDSTRETLMSVDREWKFLEDYLAMERIRFGEYVTIRTRKAGDFARMKIPPLSFQPVVENCFKHGQVHQSGGGRIDILLKRWGDGFCYKVTDNGRGTDSTGGRTLDNIRMRLGYQFASVQYRLRNPQSGGTTVTYLCLGAKRSTSRIRA